MSRPFVLGLAFLLTLGAVVGASAAGGVVLGPENTDPPAVETQQYNASLVSEDTPGTADVSMRADADPQTIVIDTGISPNQRPRGPRALLFGLFGPDTTERDVSPLVNALIANGHEVRVYTPPAEDRRQRRPGPGGQERLSPLGEELADADALITFRTDYDDPALSDLETFLEEDGRVLVATDPGDQFGEATPLALKSTLGASTAPGYVYNMESNDLNYQRIYAEPDGDAGLTEGVDRAVFPTASPVVGAERDAALVPTEGAELSTSRAGTDAPVLVRNGGVVMIGDTEFMTPENAQRADNDALIGNLADFLVTNDRDPDSQPPQEPTAGQQPGGPTGPSGTEGGPTRPPAEG